MTLAQVVRYLAPAVVSIALGITQTFNVVNVKPESKKKRINHAFKLHSALHTLGFLVMVSYAVQALLELVANSRHDLGLYLPKDDYVYLLGCTVFWGIVCTVGMSPEYRIMVTALVGLVFELILLALAIFIPHILAITLIRCALLVSIVLLALAAVRQTPPFHPEESEALLTNGTNGHATNGDYGATPKDGTQLSGDDEGSDADDPWDKYIEKKSKQRLEAAGNWFTYLKAYSIFIPFLLPRKNRLVHFCYLVMLFHSLCQRVLKVLIPRQLGVTLDSLNGAQSTGIVPWRETILWLILTWLSTGELLDLVWNIASQRVEMVAEYTLATKGLHHVLSLSMDFHDDADSGEIMRASRNGYALVHLMELVFFKMIPALFDLVIAFVYFTYLFDIYVSFSVAAAAVVYVYLEVKGIAWRQPLRRSWLKDVYAIMKINSGAISGWLSVAQFDNIEYESTRYATAYDKSQVKLIIYLWLRQLVSILKDVPSTIAFSSVALMVVYKITHNTASLGSFMQFVTYFSGLWSPISQLTSNSRQISDSLVDAERVLLLLQTKASPVEAPDSKELVVTNATVSFEAVEFAYDERRVVLKGLSFEAEGGKSIALVGETGSGKSTILKLLFRFYDVTNGAIKIDGQDLRHVTFSSLRKALGIVPQEPQMFNITIMENVRYGRLDATDDEVREACMAAAIHDKIMTFPDKYNTKIGNNGKKLSGGEKQRVAIARCLLRNPRVLLLDEASSSVDTETESLIQESLNKLCAGRTTIAIAHRLSTIVNSDIILVVHAGEIVERGTHEELLKQGGRYHKLWTMQITASTGVNSEAELVEILAA